MVYFRTLAQVRNAFQPLVGKCEYLTSSFVPDIRHAIRMANLQPGQRVLDLGTGGGEVVATAKTAVQGGLCVGLDAVQGFLDVDVPHRLARSELTVAPQGSAANQVHLVRGSVTDGNLPTHIHQLVGQQAKFDVIFALNVFNTIPPDERRQALLTWKRMLADGGRIIVSMSARFSRNAASIQGPLQFGTQDCTEAPGCVVIISNSVSDTVTAADGSVQRERCIIAATQMAPDRLWEVARQQSVDAATSAGLRVVGSRDIGKGDSFGLPHTLSSPAQATLNSMTVAALRSWMRAQLISGHQCWGRFYEELVRKTTQGWGALSANERDVRLVECLQRAADKRVTEVNEQRERILAQSPPRECPNVAEHHQLGVVVELRV